MAKPIIKPIEPFDAASNAFISFVWNGAMAYNNRIVVYNATTMNVVYDHTYSGNYYKLNHEIPANTLTNGLKYAVQISVIDRNGDVSDFSDKYYFWVLESPTFYFEGLDPDNITLIESSSYVATLHYEQEDGVKISSYQFFLYNSTKELLDSSEIMKDESLTYTYRTLETNTAYYLRATGYNAKNTPLDTGFVPIAISYIKPSFYARMFATANPIIGTVDYWSNLIDIESDRPASEYSFEEGYIDLTNINTSAQMTFSESNSLLPTMIVDYLNVYGADKKAYAINTSSVTVKGYSEIHKISIEGKYKMVSEPILSLNSYVPGYFEYVDTCNLTINDNIYRNIIEHNPLRALPNDVYDVLEIDNTGTRIINKRVGAVTIGSRTNPFSTGVTRNKYGRSMFTAYYDIGTTATYGTGCLVCDALPINTDTSCAIITSNGLLALMWDTTECYVTNLRTARTWLSAHPVFVLFPLKNPEFIFLESIVLPRMINTDSIRYSKNFIIPADNATISLKMKYAFKTHEIMRVQTKDDVALTLSSMIYDDNTLRFKLTVYGSTSNYVIYSDALWFTNYDIVTIHVRRKEGVYGLYVFVENQSPDPNRNYWFMTNEPPIGNTERGDIWINIDYPTAWIDKDTVVRYYQDNEPTTAQNENIWIGR